MGPPASFPGMHIGAVLAGRPMVAPCDPTPHNPIHVDDMAWQVEPLLDAASTRACIVNWCGDDVTTAQEWMRQASEWSGRPGTLEIREVPCSPPGALADRDPASRAHRTLQHPLRGLVPVAVRHDDRGLMR